MPLLKVKPLKNMTGPGFISPENARIWVRTENPGDYKILWKLKDSSEYEEHTFSIVEGNKRDNTISVLLPPDPEKQLKRDSEFEYRVITADGSKEIGSGSFKTPPLDGDKPSKFSFGIISCNQPFEPDGSVKMNALSMFMAVQKVFAKHDVRFVYAMGDQIYSDFPPSRNIFDPEYFKKIDPEGRENILDLSEEEIRQVYQERYRHIWNIPVWNEIISTYPMYMVLDDHDIIDNWGSDPKHSEERWRKLGRGAFKAYLDYQASRLEFFGDDIPEKFSFVNDYANTSTYFFDLRSQRKPGEDGRLFGEKQYREIRDFFESKAPKKDVIFVVMSVPLVHVPKFFAQVAKKVPPQGEDFSDRWSSYGFIRDRDFILKLIANFLKKYPDKEVILLAGDIHIGTAHKITPEDPDVKPFYQFVSSPVSNEGGAAVRYGSKALVKMKVKLATEDGKLDAAVKLLKGTEGANKNPYDRMNVGIVEVDNTGEKPKVTFFLYGHHYAEPKLVFKETI